jgi:methionyl-tRNA synthetase
MDGKAPWSVIKHDEKEFLRIMTNLVYLIYNISWMLLPFLPETSNKIFEKFGADVNSETIDNYKFRVQKTSGLFPRLD